MKKKKTNNFRKLEEDDSLSHQILSHDFKIAMQKGRIAKKLTQKELAIMMNEKVDVVNQYESGKAIPNNQFIAKIERILSCKLPRALRKKDGCK